MPTINSIEAGYRLYLSRLSKQSTRKDYTMRFNVFLTWCSMERIDRLEEVNFAQFLDYVFLDRGVSPRTHNNYRTWLRSFSGWMRRQHLLEGDPLDGVPPMREPGKIRQPLPTMYGAQFIDTSAVGICSWVASSKTANWKGANDGHPSSAANARIADAMARLLLSNL